MGLSTPQHHKKKQALNQNDSLVGLTVPVLHIPFNCAIVLSILVLVIHVNPKTPQPQFNPINCNATLHMWEYNRCTSPPIQFLPIGEQVNEVNRCIMNLLACYWVLVQLVCGFTLLTQTHFSFLDAYWESDSLDNVFDPVLCLQKLHLQEGG